MLIVSAGAHADPFSIHTFIHQTDKVKVEQWTVMEQEQYVKTKTKTIVWRAMSLTFLTFYGVVSKWINAWSAAGLFVGMFHQQW